MSERIKPIIRGLLATAGVATYGYIVSAEASTRPPTPGSSYSARLTYANAEISAAADALNPDQRHLDLFGARLSLGQQDPQAALRHVRNAELALPSSDWVNIDLQLAEDDLKQDLRPQSIPTPTSEYSYPPHPYDSERMWLNAAKADVVYDRQKGGS